MMSKENLYVLGDPILLERCIDGEVFVDNYELSDEIVPIHGFKNATIKAKESVPLGGIIAIYKLIKVKEIVPNVKE
jgi:hypothetical protein